MLRRSVYSMSVHLTRHMNAAFHLELIFTTEALNYFSKWPQVNPMRMTGFNQVNINQTVQQKRLI